MTNPMVSSEKEALKKPKLFFSPPLFKQRRRRVLDILDETSQKKHVESGQKILDIGCGQGALLEVLVNDCQFSLVSGLDIEVSGLAEAKGMCSPTQRDKDFLRELPVDFYLFLGSIGVFDHKVWEMNHEIMTMIEVVEHLPHHIITSLPHVVFGGYQPEIVIISTPNFEFNILFNDASVLESSDPGHFHDNNSKDNIVSGATRQYRHWDHQFEWTRSEFQLWCLNICSMYHYRVSFSGVGVLESMEYDDTIGYATQFAHFERLAPIRTNLEQILEHLQSLSIPTSIQDIDDLDRDSSMQVDLDSPSSATSYHPYCHVSFPYFSTIFSREEQFDVIYQNIYKCIHDWTLFQLKNIIPLHQLWTVLEIRQACKIKSQLVQLLALYPETLTVNLEIYERDFWNSYLSSGFQSFFNHDLDVMKVPVITLLTSLPTPPDHFIQYKEACLEKDSTDLPFEELESAADFIALNQVEEDEYLNWGDDYTATKDFKWC